MCSGSTIGASFDCSKAESGTEKAICANGELSQLDDDLASAYAEAGMISDKTVLHRDQRAWVQRRDAECKTNGHCLLELYRTRIASLRRLATQADHFGLKLVRISNAYRPSYIFGLERGRLIFSQYASSGNAHDIISLDPASGAAEILVSEVREGRYIDADDKFIAVTSQGRLTRPLSIHDRKTGRLLRKKGLQRTILAGRIRGNRLVAVQPGEGVVFDMDSLQVVATKTLPALDRAVFLANDLILTLSRNEANLYDENFNKVGVLPAPARPPHPRFGCGVDFGGSVGNRVVLQRNCGELVIYDLPSRAIERVIPRYAIHSSVAIVDELIFALNTSQFKPGEDGRVFDLLTGEELGALTLPGHRLIGLRNGLITMGGTYSGSRDSVMSVFAVDHASYRDLALRTRRLVDGFQTLRTRGKVGDTYAQITDLEDIGARGFAWRLANGSELAPSVTQALRKYGELLAATFTRSNEGIALLRVLAERDPKDLSLASTLANAIQRVQTLSGSASSQKGTDLRNPSATASPLLSRRLSEPVSAPSAGATLGGAVRSDGEHIFVGWRDCNAAHKSSGVRVDVFDRISLKRLAVVPIAPCEDSESPQIDSLELTTEHLIANLSNRTTSVALDHVAVIDRRSLEPRNRKVDRQSEVVYRFSMEGSLICDCEKARCSVFDVETWRATGTVPKVPRDLQCPGNSPSEEECYKCASPRAPNDIEGHGVLLGFSDKYLALQVRDSRDHNAYKLRFVSTADGRDSAQALAVRNTMFRGFTGDGTSILLSTQENDTGFLRIHDIAGGRTTTLLDFAPRYSGIPTAAYGQYVLVGYGRDLYVYDSVRMRLVWFEPDFIDGGFRNNGSGLDRNQIARFVIVGHRVFVVTFDGKESRSLDMEKLLQAVPRTGDVLAFPPASAETR